MHHNAYSRSRIDPKSKTRAGWYRRDNQTDWLPPGAGARRRRGLRSANPPQDVNPLTRERELLYGLAPHPSCV